MHEGEWDAREDGGNAHGRQRPLWVVVLIDRTCGSTRDALYDPVVRRTESRQKETAEREFFKKWSDRYAEAEEQPSCTGNAKDLVDGGVCRSGHQYPVQHGGEKAKYCYADQPSAEFESRGSAPLKSLEETFVPYRRKDDKASRERDEVLNRLAAQRVMKIGDGFFEGRDAEEMEMQAQ